MSLSQKTRNTLIILFTILVLITLIGWSILPYLNFWHQDTVNPNIQDPNKHYQKYDINTVPDSTVKQQMEDIIQEATSTWSK